MLTGLIVCATFVGAPFLTIRGRDKSASIAAPHSLFGEAARAIARTPPATEFEHGVQRFGYLLLEAAVFLAIVVFASNDRSGLLVVGILILYGSAIAFLKRREPLRII